jgi:uncharacterized protein
MKRYLYESLLNDVRRKMVFLTGPRQVGKTYLAKELMVQFKNPQYLNYDNVDDAKTIMSRAWAMTADMIVLDEVHKMKGWKTFLKGTYDTKAQNQSLLVTGSSRLDTFRQTGESLAGRYFHFRLHPISVRELRGTIPPHDAVESLNRFGGFPEPFLSGSEVEAARWRNQYYTDLVREDVLEFGRLHEIRAMRLLLELLRKKVGSPLSYTAIAGDLQLAPNTVRRYVDILESLHIIFLVRPYHVNIARAILKEPKVYFYDTGYVEGDDGVKLENTCAACLLKHVHFLQDSHGANMSLGYIRTKNGTEIDFVISEKTKIKDLIEVKLSDTSVSRALRSFHMNNAASSAVQLVHNLGQERNAEGIRVVPAGQWLSELSA